VHHTPPTDIECSESYVREFLSHFDHPAKIASAISPEGEDARDYRSHTICLFRCTDQEL
jgi:hypothetical protein